jgi:hypothetical protein
MKRRPLAGLSVLLALLAACDIPSAAPNWTMAWNVPGQSTSISVNSILPNGVTAGTLSNGTSVFQVTVNPVTIQPQTLGQDCGAACTLFNGQTIPKPAFTGLGSGTATLPPSVTTATLTGDTLTLSISNGFDFDPINPTRAGTAIGYVVTTVTSGTTVIGKDSAFGGSAANSVAIPANGGILVRKIPLSGVVSASGVSVAVTFNSPAGDAVTINTAETISFSASVGTLKISSATVALGGTTLTPSTPTAVNLSGISSSVTQHVNSGFFILAITNPFGASGNLTATFTGGPAPVSKPLVLSSAATSTDTLNFTSSDLTNLLGYNLTLSFTGNVSGTATITPGQTVGVTSRLQINVSTVSQ